MKLLTIANRYYLMTVLLVFLLGSLAAYLVLTSIINREFNQKLLAEQSQLIDELHRHQDLQERYYLNIGDRISVTEMVNDPQLSPMLRDTIMYDEYEKKELPFRTLTFSEQIRGNYYVITITKSLLPNQDLIEGIGEIMIGLVALLSASLLLLNRYISRKLWSPFYQMITQLKSFNIAKPHTIRMEETRVDEFRQLKKVLDSMIKKNRKDYKNLKEYTENTSHEIQTPLSIIKNKSEILLQEALTEQQLNEVGQIYEAAGRLSRLKEGLSMLARIDSNQFVEAELIHIKEFLETKLQHFGELIELKRIKVAITCYAEPVILLNNDLAYMLITNLLSNAIKHNVHGGKINIVLKENELMIENTGEAPGLPTAQLFGRFVKSGKNKESFGLGLSLIKRIAELYEMKIKYVYADNWHRIFVNF